MGYMHLENIQEEDKVIEKISMQIVEKSTNREFYFDNDQACCDVTIKLYLNVLSMQTNDIDVYEIDETETHISSNVKNAINEYMQKYNNQLMEMCEKYKTDVYRFNTRLFQLKNKEYKKYVSMEEQNNGYIENTRINLKIEIESKL